MQGFEGERKKERGRLVGIGVVVFGWKDEC